MNCPDCGTELKDAVICDDERDEVYELGWRYCPDSDCGWNDYPGSSSESRAEEMIYIVIGAVAIVFFLLGIAIGERTGTRTESDKWQEMAQRVKKDAKKILGKERVAEIVRESPK